MAAKTPAKRTRRVYSPPEIEAALRTLVYYGGNTSRTSAEVGIPQQTLHDWRAHDHRDRYLEIAEREAPKLEALAAQQARELILRAGDAEHGLLDKLNTALANDETTPKELSELAGTLQRLTTSKGINGTKLLELTGRPTQIVEHRDPKQAATALARRLGLTIDSTAEDITSENQATPQKQALPVKSGGANARETQSHQGAAD